MEAGWLPYGSIVFFLSLSSRIFRSWKHDCLFLLPCLAQERMINKFLFELIYSINSRASKRRARTRSSLTFLQLFREREIRIQYSRLASARNFSPNAEFFSVRRTEEQKAKNTTQSTVTGGFETGEKLCTTQKKKTMLLSLASSFQEEKKSPSTCRQRAY